MAQTIPVYFAGERVQRAMQPCAGFDNEPEQASCLRRLARRQCNLDHPADSPAHQACLDRADPPPGRTHLRHMGGTPALTASACVQCGCTTCRCGQAAAVCPTWCTTRVRYVYGGVALLAIIMLIIVLVSVGSAGGASSCPMSAPPTYRTLAGRDVVTAPLQ